MKGSWQRRINVISSHHLIKDMRERETEMVLAVRKGLDLSCLIEKAQKYHAWKLCRWGD